MQVIASDRRRKKRLSRNRILKIVRRTHMYTGLVLLPWVMLFGFSGMLFNHPEWFGPVEVMSDFSYQELAEGHSLILPNAEKIANEVVEKLNESSGSARFVRPANDAIIEGAISYEANTQSGPATVIISPNGHGAKIRRPVTSVASSQEKPDFNGAKIQVEEYDAKAFEEVAKSLIHTTGVNGLSSIEPSRRGGAEVRFQIESAENGNRWNVIYGLGTQEISARAADSPSGMNPYSLLTRLHKTHHYPDRVGARWFWTLIADATGITMVFWGLSGLAMWWQIKPSRLMGISGLVVALAIAGFVFSGTIANHTFGPARQRTAGPPSGKGGEKGTPNNRQSKTESLSTSRETPSPTTSKL